MSHSDEPSVSRVSQAPCDLGESPVWDPVAGCLWWIDGVAGRIYRRDWSKGALSSWAIGGHIGAIALAQKADLVVTRDHDFLHFDAQTGATRVLHHLQGADPNMRLNDAKLDRQGRLGRCVAQLLARPTCRRAPIHASVVPYGKRCFEFLGGIYRAWRTDGNVSGKRRRVNGRRTLATVDRWRGSLRSRFLVRCLRLLG